MTTFNSLRVNHCLLVRMNINGNIYKITNHYQPLTYNGEDYIALSTLLNVGTVQNDLQTTREGVAITLSGITPEIWGDNAGLVLNAKVKGSVVQIYRALFSNDWATMSVYPRFTGIITEMAIQDEIDENLQDANKVISIQCANANAILENKITGRRTNPKDYARADNTITSLDKSFSRVATLHNTQFDFGRPYKGTPQTPRGASSGAGAYGGGERDFTLQP